LDLRHPIIESLLLPLLLAAVLTGGIRFAFAETRGRQLAAAGAGCALLVAAWLIVGASASPPQTAVQALLFIIAGGVLLGGLLDLTAAQRSIVFTAAALWLLAAYAWFAWSRAGRADLALVGTLAAGYLLSVIVLFRLSIEERPSINATVALIVGALGLAGGALTAGSIVLFQLAAAAAAALCGFALWNWPKARFPFGAVGILGAGVGVLALAASTLLITGIRPWALLALAAVFFVDPIARRLPVSPRFGRQSVEPIYVALLALVPAVVAVLLATPAEPIDNLLHR
jgi:hypothetical protein